MLTDEESDAIATKCDEAFERAQRAWSAGDKAAMEAARIDHARWGAFHNRLASGATLH